MSPSGYDTHCITVCHSLFYFPTTLTTTPQRNHLTCSMSWKCNYFSDVDCASDFDFDERPVFTSEAYVQLFNKSQRKRKCKPSKKLTRKKSKKCTYSRSSSNIADAMTKRQCITTHKAEVKKNNLTWNGNAKAKRSEHIANSVTRVTKKAPPHSRDTKRPSLCELLASVRKIKKVRVTTRLGDHCHVTVMDRFPVRKKYLIPHYPRRSLYKNKH